jgi:hypothetical protein
MTTMTVNISGMTVALHRLTLAIAVSTALLVQTTDTFA